MIHLIYVCTGLAYFGGMASGKEDGFSWLGLGFLLVANLGAMLLIEHIEFKARNRL